MKEGKVEVLRKVVMIITVILIFATAGLFLISTQVKTVVLNYYGSIKTVRTLSTTVDSFLLQNKIYLSENTQITPSVDSSLENGMEIKIYSSEEIAKLNLEELASDYNPIILKVEEVVESIPYAEETKNNPVMDRGTTGVLQEGSDGEKTTKYLVKYSNNEEIYRAELGTIVTEEATNKIIEVGTKLVPVVSRSSIVTSVSVTPVDEGFKQYNIKLPVEQQEYAYNICKKYGIDYELFLAMMYKESGYNQYAVGGGNSYGLCQIHISNHAKLSVKLGISDFYNPYDNMTAGAYLLSLYFGTARTQVSDQDSIEAYALNSYNMGEGLYYSLCFSQGILNREYSNSIKALRTRLIANGGL